MTAKSYVVLAESGEYDNYHTCVVASFDCEDAEDAANAFAAALQKANDAYVDYKCVNCDSLFTDPITQVFENQWWECKCSTRPQPIDPTNDDKESRKYSVLEVLRNPSTEWL